MAKIGINEAEHYGNSGGTGWFTLKDDKDTAKVRFMYNDVNDMSMNVVHEVEVDGKKRYVNCIRTHDEPVDNCPLCRAGYKQSVKMFVPLYNEDAGEMQIWSRGRTFASQLVSLAGRYNPLCSAVMEIERQGRKGEQTTRYQIYPDKMDDTTLEDLPDVPDVIGGIVMDKSFDELEQFVSRGSFPSDKVERREEGAIQRRGSNRPKF